MHLARLGVKVDQGWQPGLRDPAAEARLLEAQINMELEHNDVLKASSVALKFVAFQAPSSLPHGKECLPKSMFFTFKFYTFPATQTESVHLRLTKQLEAGTNPDEEVNIELAKKYYLI